MTHEQKIDNTPYIDGWVINNAIVTGLFLPTLKPDQDFTAVLITRKSY